LKLSTVYILRERHVKRYKNRRFLIKNQAKSDNCKPFSGRKTPFSRLDEVKNHCNNCLFAIENAFLSKTVPGIPIVSPLP
jgi:hypothetical protein